MDALCLFYMEVDQIANFGDIEKAQDDKEKEKEAAVTAEKNKKAGKKTKKKKKKDGNDGADGADDDADDSDVEEVENGGGDPAKRDRHKQRRFFQSMDRVCQCDLCVSLTYLF